MNLTSSKNLIRAFAVIIIFFLLLTGYVYFQIMDISSVEIPVDYNAELENIYYFNK